MALILFVSLIVLLLLGVPVAITLGSAVLLSVIFASDFQLTAIVTRMFAGVDSFPIMAVPLFLLVGGLMETSGISDRLINFANELIGHIRAGLAMVTVLACMLFAGISGSAVADTAAVGTFTMPQMKRKGYNPDFSAALLAASGSIGPILPPSTIMIIVGVVGGVSIGGLFLGGIIPGILIGLALMVVAQIHVRKNKQTEIEIHEFNMKRLGKSFIKALPALGAPIIILGGIISGVFTATESAAVAVWYSLIVGLFIYRELKWNNFWRAVEDAVSRTSMVLLIIATASAFAWVVAIENIPRLLVDFMMSISHSDWVFLLFVNILFLLVGAFMEGIAAILILFPILLPAAMEFGIDPLHLAIVVSVNVAIGTVTPPYGITLFTACSIAQRPISKVTKYVMPMIAAMVVVLLLITYLPDVTLWIPRMFMD